MFREKIKVLDCTIRDGGLMNNHDFDLRFVRQVYQALSEAGIDYMEVGYKNSKRLFNPKEYGKWKFSDDQDIREVIQGIPSQTKISVMVDVDRVDLDDVLPKQDSPVDMIRVATYVKDVDKAIYLVNHFADKGYETTVNIMAISRALDSELTECLQQLERECQAQIIYIVDSFGSLYQETTEFLIKKAKSILKNNKKKLYPIKEVTYINNGKYMVYIRK